MAIDRLLANGTVIGGCNVALQVQSKMLAGNAGVSADEAAKEWAANVVPGHHHHSIRNMGGEPRAGRRLHVLRGRLISTGMCQTENGAWRRSPWMGSRAG
jgi:hypothetical protein